MNVGQTVSKSEEATVTSTDLIERKSGRTEPSTLKRLIRKVIMNSTKKCLYFIGVVLTLTFVSAAPSLNPHAGSKEVLSKPDQVIRRFDGTVEDQPTSRNTIRRKRDLMDSQGESRAAITSAARDRVVLSYVTAMRDYSEAAYLLLRRMKQINESFGADALSSAIVSTLRNESEFEALKQSLNSGNFNPLIIVRNSTTSEGRNSNKKWEGELKDSLFHGFSKKAVESNVPWDNILYEPEEEYFENEFEEMFAKWDLGYSVAKFLWTMKIKRKETSLRSTVSNYITERLSDMCQSPELKNQTLEYLSVVEYLQKNETIFSKIEDFVVTEELSAGIVALMQIMSDFGKAGTTINPYTKGSDIYNSMQKILNFEMKKENLTDELDMFVRKYLKFIAFASEEKKNEVASVFQPLFKAFSSYFDSCDALDIRAIAKFTQYAVDTLSKYSQISKSYLQDEYIIL